MRYPLNPRSAGSARGRWSALCLLGVLEATACTIIERYPEPIVETGIDLCTNRQDDDFDGLADEAEAQCAPFWPALVERPSPPAWACPAGWVPQVLAASDGPDAAAIDLSVAVCVPGAAIAAPLLPCASPAGGRFTYVAPVGADGDGTEARPFGSIDEATRAGAHDLWLTAGVHTPPSTLGDGAAPLTLSSDGSATLSNEEGVLLYLTGPVTLCGLAIRTGLSVDAPTTVVVSDGSLNAPGPAPLTISAASASELILRRVTAAPTTDLAIALSPTVRATLSESAFGRVHVVGTNAHVTLRQATFAAGVEPAVALSGPFAALVASDVRILRPPDIPTEAALLEARDGVLVDVRSALLSPGQGGGLLLDGTETHADLADVVLEWPATMLAEPAGRPAISVTGAATLTTVRLALLNPPSDGVVEDHALSAAHLTDTIVYRDSRWSDGVEPQSCGGDGGVECGLGRTCDGASCVLPWTVAAVRLSSGALDVERLYVEGVDGIGVWFGAQGTGSLKSVTIVRVRARVCSAGRRSNKGVGIYVESGASPDLSYFLIDRTNGAGLSYDAATGYQPTDGAFLDNLSALWTGHLGVRARTPPRVVFRGNGSDYDFGGGSCFREISVDCNRRLEVCP